MLRRRGGVEAHVPGVRRSRAAATAGRDGGDAAAWVISEPGPLPELVGNPVMALVLRREVRDDDDE